MTATCSLIQSHRFEILFSVANMKHITDELGRNWRGIMRTLINGFLVLFAWCWLAPSHAQEAIRPAGKRIVGGEPTTIERHPWQVALKINRQGQTYLCGGSIIADKWVLTAAHCFDKNSKATAFRAKSGVTNYVKNGKWLQAEKVIRHSKYNSKTHEHDIALVKLKTTPKGRVIPLYSASAKIPVGQQLEVTGWGATKEAGDGSSRLRKASVPYVDNTTCNAASSYDGAIKNGMMCAGKQEGGVDACQGDSGGPLVWRTMDGAVLVGVVSWGHGCARKLKYGAYTRVAHYARWIGEMISKN